MTFKILRPGTHTTIQDEGRNGFYHLGITVSGAIDKKKVSNILKQITPFGFYISRSLKNQKNLISKSKLKDFLNQISVG